MLCRAVYVAIPVCVVGVVFITQPSWLGGGTHPRSALGIILAIGQVSPHTPELVVAHIPGRHCDDKPCILHIV